MGQGTLLLALGNELLQDDGVGLVAGRRVAELAGERADFMEECVATIDLLQVIEGYDRVVVVDAYLSDSEPPGTPIQATPDELPRGFGYRSFHTLPFTEMLDLGRRLGLDMPSRFTIHGLAVDQVDVFGSSFTPRVEAAWRGWAKAIAGLEFGPDS